MSYLFLFILLFASPTHAKDCAYPGDPANWIMRYCGYKIETDDEIAIFDSACYKADSAERDRKSKDKCALNEKYKTKLCQEFLMKDGKYKALKDCLKDPALKEMSAGE